MSNGNCTGYQVKMSGFQTQLGHCVVFLGEALFSHSASLQSGVKMDTGKLCVGGGGRCLEMDWHPIQGGSSTAPSILVASCY